MAASDFDIIDPSFGRLVKGSARVEKLWEGCRWAEGPAWFPLMRSVIWSDIPNDRMLRWDETTGTVGVFRNPAGYSNGNTVDRQGRLVSCEHGNRRVTRTEHDGSITVLADSYDGKRLNSPNDVVVKSDDSVWFTDPPYGIDSDYEGHKGDVEQAGNYVFRIDGKTGEITIASDTFDRPNGLAFTPDESHLVISDTGSAATRHFRKFAVNDDGTLSGGDVFATCTVGGFDGFRFDTDGNIWTSAGDGVHCINPEGKLIGKVFVPEGVANVVFGGAKRNRLFICGTSSLYSIMLPVQGDKTF